MHTHKSDKEFPKVFPLIKQSIETYKSHYKVILGISLIPLIFSILTVMFDSITQLLKGFNLGIQMLVIAISIIITILASISQLSMQIGVFSFLKTKTGDIKHLMEHGLKLFLPAILVVFITSIIILGSIPLLVIPAIIASFVFSFSIISLAQDGKRNLSALGQSLYVTEGRIMNVFWNYLVFGLIIVGFSILVIFFGLGLFVMPNGETWSTFFWMCIQHIIIMPLSLIYAHHLMDYLRSTKPTFLPELEMLYRARIKKYIIASVVVLVLTFALLLTFITI